jgi:alpha-D-ribose 1-methylphosphonate 5-triphosphate diphosphatase
MEAARAAREGGLAVMMGAPNLVRGGSHSGNVSALEVARAGCLSCLSSDYVPASLIHGAWLLHSEAGWSLEEALATVTSAPAEAVGLDDRGRLAPDCRADVVRVRLADGRPMVRAVWVAGERVF